MTPSILTAGTDISGERLSRREAERSDWRLYAQVALPAPEPSRGTAADDGRTLLGAAIALRTALQQTGDALAAPNLAALLESEAGLAAALTVLPTASGVLGEQRDRIFHELALARQELTRCRCLGTSLSDTVKQTLRAAGVSDDYGPNGRSADLAERSTRLLQTRG